jgi:hypothetical protein
VHAIKYLLLVLKRKREANATNKIGYTTLEYVLKVCLRDFKCFEIQNILKEAGVRTLPLTPSGIGVDEAQPPQSGQPPRSRFKRWSGFVRSLMSKTF